MTPLAPLLLNLSDNTLDPIAKEDIRSWASPPTALQILHTLDICVHGSLCPAFVIAALNVALIQALDTEGTSLDAITPQATWRTP